MAYDEQGFLLRSIQWEDGLNLTNYNDIETLMAFFQKLTENPTSGVYSLDIQLFRVKGARAIVVASKKNHGYIKEKWQK